MARAEFGKTIRLVSFPAADNDSAAESLARLLPRTGGGACEGKLLRKQRYD